ARAERARRFDRALEAVSLAWQQVLVEHGRLVARDRRRRGALMWGLSLDETSADRLRDLDSIAAGVKASGADWVRVVFGVPRGDLTFARRDSFNPYDALIVALERRKLRVMGSVLDSMLWPPGLTPELYAERTRHLAEHYKRQVRLWEVASEPDGNWLGGDKPLDPEDVLLCVQKGVVAVKEVDPKLETAATLQWWDGTAPDGRHGLYDWLPWAVKRGFGAGIDLVGLSLYPHRNPVGLALEPAFRELRAELPGKRYFLAGWSFGDQGQTPPYWWLDPKAVDGPRKDLTTLFTAAAPALVPESVGGGFFWPTLEQMLPAGLQPTSLYRVYKKTLREDAR
ncbi:MAG: hypothetical protein KGL53_01620, partial [Elusimicrobia bacterium]|nr:hypothetical protein [Elusimicrobiota bacterium]